MLQAPIDFAQNRDILQQIYSYIPIGIIQELKRVVCNTVIFYDIENLTGIFNGKTNMVLHLDEIYRRVLEMDGVSGVSIQRAYADWGMPINRNLRSSVLQVGIEPIHIFNTNQYDKVKNAADISLIIDAVDLAARRPEIENFVIASGDGIFAFLAKKLHEHGKRVIGCSFDSIANNIFRNSCDYFIALEKNDASIIMTSSKRNNKSSAKVSEVVTTPEVETKPSIPTAIPKTMQKFPRTKYSEALYHANIDQMRDDGDFSAAMHTVRKIVDALFIEETKDMAGLEVSVFVTYINHFLPGFRVKTHGFKQIRDLMRFVFTGSRYCMYSIEDNVLLMATRETAEAASGKIIPDLNGLLITLMDGSKYNSIFNVEDGEPFVYTVAPTPKTPKVNAKPKQIKEEEPAPVVDEAPLSIRKWIKLQFENFSENNSLSADEVLRMTTPEYSRKKFGVRSPVLREINEGDNIDEVRKINNKVKYWKELFKFNGKTYIVYKEWVASIHKNRFEAWSKVNVG